MGKPDYTHLGNNAKKPSILIEGWQKKIDTWTHPHKIENI